MRKRSQRLWFVAAAAVLLLGGLALAVPALQSAWAYFQSPTDIASKGFASYRQTVRVGGLMECGSKKHDQTGKLLVFNITDGKSLVPVVYDGVAPDMVKEGKGVVAEGRFDATGRLVASRVLAKHDENYMPKEAYEALKKSEAGAVMGCGKETGA